MLLKFKTFLKKVKNNGIDYLYLSLSFRILKFFSIFNYKIYVTEPSIRSWSDDGYYPKIIKEILYNEKKFKNFKRNTKYRLILEHTNYEFGKKYLEIIRKENPDFLSKIEKFKINDLIGNPIKFNYNEIKKISPSTIRYIKVASDIKKIFGNISGNFAEIGAGYGGQYLILDKIFDINSYNIFDLNDVNKLIEKYLEHYLTNSYYQTSTINQFDGSVKFDFLISNYAFSELNKKVQIKYLQKIIQKSKKGYMTMNSGMFSNKDCLSIEEIKTYLPDIKILDENPKTYDGNYIIIWGFNN